MNDMELREKREETELLETERAPDGGSIRRRDRWSFGILCAFLAASAGVLTWILVLASGSEVGALVVTENGMFMGYFFIIPLFLIRVAFRIPRYRRKNIVALELFINAMLWLSGFYYIASFMATL